MKWNWQRPDWSEFRWKMAALASLEARFLQQSGVVIGSVKHLPADDRSLLTIDIMTGEALKTSEIEGELLSRDAFNLRCAASSVWKRIIGAFPPPNAASRK